MDMLFFGLLGAIGIVAFLWLQKGKNRSLETPDNSPKTPIAYTKKDTLLSPAERSFFGVLKQAIGDTYQIQCKVRLADILAPQKSPSRSDWQKAFNRISNKHLDFVLVRPETTEIILAIELDDSSHTREDRRQRDDFVDAAMQSAGLPLVHFPAKSAYSVQEVRSMLGLSTPIQTNTPASHPLESTPKPTSLKSEIAQVATPSCPKCAAPMVKRQASRGEHAGKLFWACSRYPECKSIISINEEPQTVKA